MNIVYALRAICSFNKQFGLFLMEYEYFIHFLLARNLKMNKICIYK